MEPPKIDKTKLGLFDKFIVVRSDGSSAVGRKHHGCKYFVLDFKHDPYAKDAVRAYAVACRAKYPKLSDDLFLRIGEEAPQ